MQSFKNTMLFSLAQFALLSCNRHDPYRADAYDTNEVAIEKNATAASQGNVLSIKLAMYNGPFTIESEGGKVEVVSPENIDKVIEALPKLPKPFLCIEDDIDTTYYDYGPSADYPNSPDRQIAHCMGNGLKEPLSIGSDLCIVGQSGRKYFFYPVGNRRFNRCPVDDMAYHVSQGSVCYATDKKMGTHNVQDCVALIMHDKKSGKTALAHVSAASLNLVNEILAHMPKGPKEVILIGGQHTSGEYNLKTILKDLAKYKDTIYIIQAYCGNKGSLLFDDKAACITTSFYHINTNFGNVIVDPKGLQLTTDYPNGTIPPHCSIQYAHYDLDKMHNR